MIEKLLSATENLWLRRLLVILSWPLAVLGLSLAAVVQTLLNAAREVKENSQWVADQLVGWAKVSARHWKAREVE